MPTDPAGIYSLPAGYKATPDTTILTSQHNPPLEDIAAALTGRLTRDGSGSMTGPLKLQAGAPTLPNEATRKDYVDRKGPVYWGGTSTGTANAQIVATSSTIFSLTAGNRLQFNPGFTNTDAATLAVDGTPATAIKKLSPFGVLPLTGKEILAGQVADVIYDGTQYVLLNDARGVGRVEAITANTTFTTSDLGSLIEFTAVTTVTATIPAAPQVGSFLIWNHSALVQNVVAATGSIYEPNGTALATLVLQPGEVVRIVSDAFIWFIADRYFQQQGIWPAGTLTGLTLSVASTTSVGVAAGTCRNEDASQPLNMVLAAALTKTFSNFVAGSGNGGLDTGTIAANSWYHIHLIRKDTGDAVDALLSLSATAPTMPAGYTARRRIGAIRTNASSQVTPFVQIGKTFLWSTPVIDVDATNPGSAAVTRTLTVPTGVVVDAVLSVGGFNGTGGSTLYFSPLVLADAAPQAFATSTLTGVATSSVFAQGGSRWGFVPMNILTNTSAQIRTRSDATGASDHLGIITRGWVDFMGTL